jgi:hypothetical protein
MPQPFRAIAPPPIATEKLLLLQSQNLALAFSVDRVQEVLLKASVTLTDRDRSVTNYRSESIPAILGKKNCPAMSEVILGIIKTPEIKGGFIAIACTNIPTLVAITPQDWHNLEIDTSPWESDRKVYTFNGITYSHVIGIIKRG